MHGSDPQNYAEANGHPEWEGASGLKVSGLRANVCQQNQETVHANLNVSSAAVAAKEMEDPPKIIRFIRSIPDNCIRSFAPVSLDNCVRSFTPVSLNSGSGLHGSSGSWFHMCGVRSEVNISSIRERWGYGSRGRLRQNSDFSLIQRFMIHASSGRSRVHWNIHFDICQDSNRHCQQKNRRLCYSSRTGGFRRLGYNDRHIVDWPHIRCTLIGKGLLHVDPVDLIVVLPLTMAPLRGLIFSIRVFSMMLQAMHTWSPAEAIRSSQFQRFHVPAKFKEAPAFRNGNECPLLTPWIIVHHHVYDCTRFLKDHPGGMDSILINAGLDCTEEFDAIHSTEGKAMLEDYRIGELVTAAAENGSSCPSSDTSPWIEGNDSPAAAAQVVDRDQRGRDFETRGSQSDAKDLQARLQDPHFLYDASSGRDGKKFVMVVAGLSILSVIGAWCSFLTVLYMGFMVSLTLPALYHKYEDKIDRFVDRASVEVKRPYVHISDKVTVAKKKLYIWFDDRVLRKILWRRVKPE